MQAAPADEPEEAPKEEEPEPEPAAEDEAPAAEPVAEQEAPPAAAATEEEEAGKKRPLEVEAEQAAEEPAAKQAKVEEAAPAPAPAAPGGPRVRKNQGHPAARALRKARKGGKDDADGVLFPVGQSPADLPVPRSLRTATPRHTRSSRAAWGRLKQVSRRCFRWWVDCRQPSCEQSRRGAHAASLLPGPLPGLPLTALLPQPLTTHTHQAAHGTLPMGAKRSKATVWTGAAEEAIPASSSSEAEEEEEERCAHPPGGSGVSAACRASLLLLMLLLQQVASCSWLARCSSRAAALPASSC